MLRRVLGFGSVIALALIAAPADAHFVLQTPACWSSQDALGSPQKVGPCGNEAGGTPSGIVTPYQPGDMVTIKLNEVITHPGHYRIALSVNDRSELPPEPIVTPGATACGSAPIMNPAVFPVLADGQLVHTSAFSGAQTIQVKLPTNVTCAKCTLQVLEFMSSHAAPCFYHHCADISIGVAAPDGGGGGMDAGSDPDGGSTTPPMQSGCACSSPGTSPALSGLGAFLALGTWLGWRRRSRRCQKRRCQKH